jgi:RND family efflux transporter MFP subunit
MKSLAAVALMVILALYAREYFDGKTPQVRSFAEAAAETPASPPAPSVVGHVVNNADLAVGREYIGRVEPIQTVNIKPQVPGMIEAVNFRDGSIVKEGELLFTIDSRQYQATVSLRKADVSKAEAGLSRASKYNDRLQAADKRSVSASDLDISANDILQGRASIEQARAALQLAQIDLDYTKVKAPISGRIGRAEATKGNYVTPGGSPLADIVQINPIRVSFAMPDRDYMEQRDLFRSPGAIYDATLTLADGSTYAHKGERDFEDVTMDVTTGTIMVYLRFKNESGVLVPGSMVRVLTKPVKSHVSAVIPLEAVLSDGEGTFVYVIDESNVAHRRDISLGVEFGTTREVLSGLEAGEKIVLRGLQNVRPETPVNPSYLSDDVNRSPADLAKESGYDLPSVSSKDESGVKSTEGKN